MNPFDNIAIRYYANGKVAEIYEFDENGDRHGYNIQWNTNGAKRREYYMEHGVLNGPRITWRDNNTKWEECHYKNGIRHGRYQAWHQNGKQYEECSFDHGDMHGLYRLWDIDGKLTEVVYYFRDDDITDNIETMVNDITCITEQEKTLIAIELGLSI